MGDGEKRLFEHCASHGGEVVPPNSPFDRAWLRQMGCLGIPCGELYVRLKRAAEECTYFAPQLMGAQRPEFDVAATFRPRDRYVDNWFVREWETKLQDALLRAAKKVCFIHGDEAVIGKFRKRFIGSAPNGLLAVHQLCCWKESDEVVERVKNDDAPLVLYAGGPAGKFIGPAIASGGGRPKVVIDLGQAAAKEWL
jgi:hypothetical protein